MNKDVFEGKWKQMRGQAKDWWGKLTDDDLERVGGKYDQFVGLLQEKYGYTRERAEEEINRRTAEHEAQQKKVASRPSNSTVPLLQARSGLHGEWERDIASRLKHG